MCRSLVVDVINLPAQTRRLARHFGGSPAVCFNVRVTGSTPMWRALGKAAVPSRTWH